VQDLRGDITSESMAETAFTHFGQLVSQAIALKPESFQFIQTLPMGTRAALTVAIIAGFSQAIGQGIVLFANRVKPFRFVLSLLIAAVLFAFGYIFWALSSWIVSVLLFGESIDSLLSIVRTLGLSYAPLTWSFLVALPYLGVPISTFLSVWSFLAFVIGLKVTLGFGLWQAFWCGALGWAVFEILQRTIGRPFAGIGRWLANTAAGVNLVTNLRDLEQVVDRRIARVIKSGEQP
jgi:hypothetical protein